MSDRRTVDELTIEELEQLLIVRRRELRSERMRRLRKIGRLPADAALPHEDLTTIGLGAVEKGPYVEPETARQRTFDLEPLRREKRRRKQRKRPARSRF